MRQPYQDPPTQPKQAAKSEVSIYDSGGIKITNLRAIFNNKTFSISNITSVEGHQVQPSVGCFAFGLILMGIAGTLLGIMAALDGEFGTLFIGLVCFGAGYALHRSIKKVFSVTLSTASGEIKAYTSENEAQIKEIIEALNTAIVKKG